jgi:4-diphosphocytidyl-2-C-methyl-D-erythritol kinase
MSALRELAPAKVNLILRIGPVGEGGLHELCSLFAPLDLHDVVTVVRADADRIVCEGVDGPNLAERALAAFRHVRPVPPVEIRIEKRIPVAAGLGGGSADAAAVLRALDALAAEPTWEWGVPFEHDGLVLIARGLGSDVPSQVTPGTWVVSGTGERLTPARPLPRLPLVLVPSEQGLSTADVYAEADRLGIPKPLEPDAATQLAAREWPDAAAVAAALHNDLEPAALSLRPPLAATLVRVRELGALGALVSGSGPTVFGVFATGEEADRAAAQIPGAIATTTRGDRP